VIVSTNEVVRWKSAPRLGAGGQVFGEQLCIVETCGSHTWLLFCGRIFPADRLSPASVPGKPRTRCTATGLGPPVLVRHNNCLSTIEPSFSTGLPYHFGWLTRYFLENRKDIYRFSRIMTA